MVTSPEEAVWTRLRRCFKYLSHVTVLVLNSLLNLIEARHLTLQMNKQILARIRLRFTLHRQAVHLQRYLTLKVKERADHMNLTFAATILFQNWLAG